MKPFVLFVCRHNTGRSQMAEAYLRHFTGDSVEVASAGTVPAERPEPVVVQAMAEDGLDISTARPKLLDPKTARRADLIITMGCDVDVCGLQSVPRIDDDWGLPDPKDLPLEDVRPIRDLVKAKARALANESLMAEKSKTGPFGDDDLDKEVTTADDTGIVSQQQEIIEDEILLGEQGKSLMNDEEEESKRK